MVFNALTWIFPEDNALIEEAPMTRCTHGWTVEELVMRIKEFGARYGNIEVHEARTNLAQESS